MKVTFEMTGGYLYMTLMPPVLEEPCHFLKVDINNVRFKLEETLFFSGGWFILRCEAKISHTTKQ